MGKTGLTALLAFALAGASVRAQLWAEHLQLDHVDPAALADPAAGFALWKQHAEANVKAWKAGQKPLSRVFPLKFFTDWSAGAR